MNKNKFYIRMITASLLRRRSRMVIALLAIAIGATILSGLVTIYYDVPRQLSAQFRNYGANMIITSEGEGLTTEDIKAASGIIDEKNLVGVTPYKYITVRVNDRPVMATGMDFTDAEKTNPFWRIEGSWPYNEKEVMIGKNVAYTYNFKVGDTMTCTYTPKEAYETQESGDGEEGTTEFIFDNYGDYKIVGILDTGGNEEEYIYMNLKDLAILTDGQMSYDICELSVSSDSKLLQEYADKITGSVDGVKARLVKRVTESETKVLSKLQALVFLVTVVVLVLTMICVATTMTAVVAERRKEIGLRKSLGADNKSIIAEFMGEGLLLGAAGGLLGSILGFVFAQAVSISVFNSSISFVWWMIPVTIVSSVVVTGIACLIPIRSATDIDPALVLKGE